MSTGIKENRREGVSTESPCDSLPGRLGDICRGYRDPALPYYSERTRRQYINLWLADETLAVDPEHPAPDVLVQEESNAQKPPKVHRGPARRPEKPPEPVGECVHLGPLTGETVHCRPCQRRTGQPADVPLYACAIHGAVTLEKTGTHTPGCSSCPDWRAKESQGEQ